MSTHTDNPTRRPTVSVVIPCYNAARFLHETLASATSQTYPPIEIVVVDDGSTDESARIAAEHGSPVRVYQQANQGESVARNRALDVVAGEWVAFLDADDRWEPDKLKMHMEAAEQGGDEVVCIYSDFYKFQDQQQLEVIHRKEWDNTPDYLVHMLCQGAPLPSTATVRTDVARAVRFPESIRDSEDVLFFLMVRTHGKFIHIPEALAGWRISEGQQSRRSPYFLRSVQARYSWLVEHRNMYTEKQFRAACEGLAQAVIDAHELAFWARDYETVKNSRRVYGEIHPDEEPEQPVPFQRKLYPRWLMKIKDQLDTLRTRGQR